MKKRKILSILLSTLMLTSLLTGCVSNEEKEQQAIDAKKQESALMEVNQNDYRGGYMRTEAIKTKIVAIVESFNQVQNDSIIQTSPSDYWNNENFLWFKNNFLVTDQFADTQYFNELETDWDTAYQATYLCFYDENGNYIKPYITNYFNIEKDPVSANLYRISYTVPDRFVPYIQSEYALQIPYEVTCMFDANHDWLQMKKMATVKKRDVYTDATGDEKLNPCEELVEYGRQKNTNSFVIQTSKERLYVTYETLEGTMENDFNPLENAKITSFAYSRLSDAILPVYMDEKIEDTGEEVLENVFGSRASSLYLTENSDIANQYNLRDSIFTHIDDITADWVLEYPFEEGYYDTYITFDGSDMTIYNKNKLSDKVEIIEFKSDGSIQDKTMLLLHPLHEVEVKYVNGDGSIHGTTTIYVNDNGDATDVDGNVLIPGDSVVQNKDGEFIFDNTLLDKLGLLPKEETEPVKEDTGSEDNPETETKE